MSRSYNRLFQTCYLVKSNFAEDSTSLSFLQHFTPTDFQNWAVGKETSQWHLQTNTLIHKFGIPPLHRVLMHWENLLHMICSLSLNINKCCFNASASLTSFLSPVMYKLKSINRHIKTVHILNIITCWNICSPSVIDSRTSACPNTNSPIHWHLSGRFHHLVHNYLLQTY